jgi:hypothetical protein
MFQRARVAMRLSDDPSREAAAQQRNGQARKVARQQGSKAARRKNGSYVPQLLCTTKNIVALVSSMRLVANMAVNRAEASRPAYGASGIG